MLYQSYRDKLAKRKRVFERVWRFRLLILIAILLVLGTAAALLGVKGMVYGEEVPATVVYGEPLSVTAQSVFGDVEFEYRAVGTEEWTREEPVYAGEYECRAVGVSSAGTDRSGSIYTFRILPLEVTVNVVDDSLIYGETPSFSASLRYGDTLRVGNFFADRTEDGKHVAVSADPLSITAVSASGADVTSSYVFAPVEKTVIDIFREITVQTPTVSFEYDGTAHATEVEAAGLVEGHTVEAELASITEAGSCENSVQTLKILDENGADVTDRYRINYKIGTLTVTPRPITVTTPSSEIVYDGQMHPFGEAVIAEGSLAEGQTAHFTAPSPVKEANTYENRPALSIAEGETEISLKNYAVTWEYGTLTVAPRPVTLRTPSASIEYDGQMHPFGEAEIAEGSFADGQTAHFTAPSPVKEAATYENRPALSITEGETAVPLKNYALTWECGTLEIYSRAVTLQTGSGTWTYDGTAHGEQTYTELVNDLASGHTIEITYPAYTERGEYQNEPSAYTVYDGEHNDVTANYTVTWAPGTLEISPRPVSVVTGTDSWTYDDADHRDNSWVYAEGYEESGFLAFVEGQTLVIAEEDSPAVRNYDGAEHENKPAKFSIMADGVEISLENYDITWDYGTLTITKRPITVTTQNEEWTYDGTSHTGDTQAIVAYYEENDLGHTVVQSFTPHINVSESGVNNVCSEVHIFAGETEVTENYEITYQNTGVVTIHNRPVTFGTKSHDPWEYDGKPHSLPEAELRGENGSLGLAAEHTFSIAAEDAPVRTDVGSWSNQFSYTVSITAGETDVTENYAITYSETYGTLGIYSRSVTLQTGSGTWTYDGKEHDERSYSAVENTLAEGHTIEITYPTIKTKGELPNEPSAYTVYDGEHKDVTANYTVTWASGELIILARAIKFRTDGETWVYDAEAHTNQTISPTEADMLAPGQHIEYTVTWAPSVTNFGDDRLNAIEFTPVITDENGVNVTENYEYNIEESEWGTLAITKRPITVTTQDEEWVYDGTSHTAEKGPLYTYYTEDGKGENGDLGHDIVPTFEPRVNVSESGSNNVCKVQILSGGVDVIDNYEITYENTGVVSILKRPLTVTTQDEEWTYDGVSHTDRKGPLYTYYAEDGKGDLGHDIVPAFTPRVNVADSGFNECTVQIWSGGVNVTENYEITYQNTGLVTIDPRPIAFGTQQHDPWQYDGTLHAWKEIELREENGSLGLVAGHGFTFSAESSPAQKTVGKWSNEFTYDVTITDKNGEEVTGNYAITYSENYGLLEIYKRAVTLRTGSSGETEWTYDGKPHAVESYTDVGETKLVVGHKVEIAYPKVKEKGEYSNKPESFTVYDEEDISVTENYEITWEYGTLTIFARAIKFQTAGETWVYDAEAHTNRTISPTEADMLAPGQYIEYTVSWAPSVTNFGDDCLNAIDFTPVITDESGEDVTSNYAIDEEVIYGTLAITKRPITVTTQDEEWVYDGTSHTAEKGPRYTYYTGDGKGDLGHEIVPTFTPHINVSESGINNECAIRIFAGETDVTYNYEIHYENTGVVTINKRPLTVTTQDEEWTYDGTSHTGEIQAVLSYYEEDGRGDLGHTFKQTFTPRVNVTDSGVNECKVHIFAGEDEVTENYEIDYRYTGKVTIKLRPLTITAKTETFDYDGKPHTYNWDTLEVVGDLASGQYFHLENVLTAENANTYENDPDIYIYAAGVKVTENYNITYTAGVITIKKLPLQIYTQTDSFVYDGEEHTYAEIGCQEKLAEGQKVERTQTLTVKDARTYINDPHYRIWDTVGNRVISKENYEISEYFGTIEIQKFTLNLSTVGERFVYDDEERVYDHYDHFKAILFGEGSSGTELPAGEKFVLSQILTVRNANGAGELNKPNIDNIVDVKGNTTTQNYKITWEEFGTVVVEPRPLTVTTKDHTWVYDGESHTGEGDYELTYYQDTPIAKHSIGLIFTPRVNVADSGFNECTVQILSGVVDVTENYEITYQNTGVVTITPRPITFGTQAHDPWQYDGELHAWKEIELREGNGSLGLVAGHSFTFSAESSPARKDAGEWSNEFPYTVSIAAGETDVTENYAITYSETYGLLKISKRAINLRTGSGHWTYDGEERSVESWEYIGTTKLVEGHTIDIIFPTKKAAGTASNVPLAVTIYDEAHEDVTENYEIKWDYGTITIYGYKVKFKTESRTWVYDGETHTANGITLTEDAMLAPGHNITYKVESLPSVTDFGDDRLNIIDFTPVITDENGVDVTENYEYDVQESEWGTLAITKRPLTVTTQSEEWVYDGTSHAADKGPLYTFYTEDGKSGFAEAGKDNLGHDIVPAFTPRVNVADSGKTNECKVQILSGGVNVTENYEITYKNEGTVTIKLRPLTVTTQSEEWVYDGTSHAADKGPLYTFYTEDGKSSSAEMGKDNLGHDIVPVFTPRVNVADSGVNKCEVHIFADGVNVTENYEITYKNEGTVTIKLRPLTVTTQSEEWVYDGMSHTGAKGLLFTYYDDGKGDLGQEIVPTFTQYTEVTETGGTIACEVLIWSGGDNVTENYKITYQNAGVVTITPRPITVSTVEETFDYDGVLHIYSEIMASESGLAPEQELVRTNKMEAQKVGIYPNDATYEIRKAGGELVSASNYTVTEEFGVVTINLRHVIFGTQSKTWVYDGDAHKWEEIEPKEGTSLAAGQEKKVTLTSEAPSVTDVKDSPKYNVFTYTVTIMAGETDVTENYQIDYSSAWGELRIEKRKVTVDVDDVTTEYDGTEQSGKGTGDGYTVSDGSLVGGEGSTHSHKAEGNFAGGKDPGSYTTDPENDGWKITDENGNDVTENYDVEWNPGTLHVDKRRIQLLSGSGEWEYDGTYHSNRSCEVTVGELLPGHEVKADYMQMLSVKYNDTGEVTGIPNMMLNTKIVEGEKDVSDYYIIERTTPGILKITPRPVTFVSLGGEYVYDAQPKSGGFALKEGSKPLVGDHELRATFQSWTDVGDYENIAQNVSVWSNKKEEGKNDVTGNYAITWENAHIVITPRPVAITTGSGTWIYDAEAHTERSFGYTAGYKENGYFEFVEGHELIIADDDYLTRTEWGVTKNEPLSYSIMAGETEIDRKNYEIEWTYGDLTVNKRPITITTQNEEWVYDGTSHAGEFAAPVITYYNEDGKGDLGHEILITYSAQTEAGDHDSVCTVEIRDKFGNSVTENYEITYENTGVISIAKRHVKVTTGSETWVYDGAYHESDGYTAELPQEDRGLLEGHEFRFTATSIKEVTDTKDAVAYVENEWTNIYIYNGAYNCTENYVVETAWGSLRIKEPVVVYVYSIRNEYKGSVVEFTEDDWYVESLPPDVTEDMVHVTLGGSLTEPGTLTLEDVRAMSVCTVDGEGVNRVDFIGAANLLQVTRRKISITTISITAQLGDEPLLGTDTQEETFWVSEGSLVKGHRFAESVRVTGKLDPTKESTENTITEIVILDSDGRDVTEFYEYTLNLGTLQWKK